MAEHASLLLRQAHIDPSDPAAQSFLMNLAPEIAAKGASSGGQSVFMTNTAAGTRSKIDQLANSLSRYKEGLLASPSLKDQALGALLDTQLPFLGIPTRVLQIGLHNLPGLSQVSGAVRLAAASTGAERQRIAGEMVMETAIQWGLANQIAAGNIRGPDDLDHPDQAQILGNWVKMRDLGRYALPAQIMAAAYEGYNKPVNAPGQSIPEAEMTHLGDALTASMKPLTTAIPGMQMLHFIGSLGSGVGLGTALRQELSDTVSRMITTGAGQFIEDWTDPTQRDVAKTGLASIIQPAMARIPGVAGTLPARIDPTTGQPMEKRSSGLGALLGVESYDESPLRVEANRLHQAGYTSITAPTTYANSVSIAGSAIPLSPDEQRAVAAITGKYLGDVGQRIQSPAYQNLPNDDLKAAQVKAILDSAAKARQSAVVQVLGAPEVNARILADQKSTGRLNAQVPYGLGDLTSSLESQIARQAQSVGVGA
jgi:hypothetical protein